MLDGKGIEVISIKLTPALSLTHVNPIGGAIGGVVETILLDEGFKQDRLKAITEEPILRETSSDRPSFSTVPYEIFLRTVQSLQ